MIEISNFNPVQKGSLIGTCDVCVKPWSGFMMFGVQIFEKGAQRWINLPSKEFTNNNGEKKYKDILGFKDESKMVRFKSEVLKEIDKFIESNPNLEPDPIVKPLDESLFDDPFNP